MEKDFNDFNFLHYYVKRKMIKTQLIKTERRWDGVKRRQLGC